MTDPKPGRLSVPHAIAQVLVAATSPDADPHALAGRLRKLADWITAGSPPKAPRSPRDPVAVTAETHAVWSYYCAAFKKTAGAKLTDDRAKMIRDRLADGMTVDRCKKAIDGLKASPFHQGQNDRNTKYQELHHAFATLEKAEQLASNAPTIRSWVKPAVEVPERAEPVADPETARQMAGELARVVGRIGKMP